MKTNIQDEGKCKLTICCVTYNQINYIRQTMDGFLMQKTNFEYEILVHDDASTDGTCEALIEYKNQYPELVKVFTEEDNQYSKNVDIWQKYLFPVAKGQYIATCDGDDYWIDSNKLQKQVDYLDKHKECSCVCHPVYYLDEKKGKCWVDHKCKYPTVVSLEKMIVDGGLYIATTSLVFRRNVAMEYPRFRQISLVADFPLQILLAIRGSIVLMPGVMAYYRVGHLGSVTYDSVKFGRQAVIEQKEIEVLNEVDKFTNNKYWQATHYRRTLYYMNQFSFNKYSFLDVLREINKINDISKVLYMFRRFVKYIGLRVYRDFRGENKKLE